MQLIKILIATLSVAATAALAQPPAGGPSGGGVPGGFGGRHFGGPPAGNIERLAVLLDLDPYQKQEVERVMKEQREAMQAERKGHEATGERPSFAEVQSRREQVREDTLGKLQNVLSELQMTKLKLLMEPPSGGPGGRHGPPAGGNESVPDGK